MVLCLLLISGLVVYNVCFQSKMLSVKRQTGSMPIVKPKSEFPKITTILLNSDKSKLLVHVWRGEKNPEVLLLDWHATKAVLRKRLQNALLIGWHASGKSFFVRDYKTGVITLKSVTGRTLYRVKLPNPEPPQGIDAVYSYWQLVSVEPNGARFILQAGFVTPDARLPEMIIQYIYEGGRLKLVAQGEMMVSDPYFAKDGSIWWLNNDLEESILRKRECILLRCYPISKKWQIISTSEGVRIWTRSAMGKGVLAIFVCERKGTKARMEVWSIGRQPQRKWVQYLHLPESPCKVWIGDGGNEVIVLTQLSLFKVTERGIATMVRWKGKDEWRIEWGACLVNGNLILTSGPKGIYALDCKRGKSYLVWYMGWDRHAMMKTTNFNTFGN